MQSKAAQCAHPIIRSFSLMCEKRDGGSMRGVAGGVSVAALPASVLAVSYTVGCSSGNAIVACGSDESMPAARQLGAVQLDIRGVASTEGLRIVIRAPLRQAAQVV